MKKKKKTLEYFRFSYDWIMPTEIRIEASSKKKAVEAFNSLIACTIRDYSNEHFIVPKCVLNQIDGKKYKEKV